MRLGRGPRHPSANGCSSKNLFSFWLALFTLGIWCIFSVDFVSGSQQCLVRQWIHVSRQYFGGYGRISHIFYVAADSNPEVLLSLLLQNGEACPVDASGCSFALRSSHLENWKYFYEFHVAETRDDGQHFLGHLCQTPGWPAHMPIRS